MIVATTAPIKPVKTPASAPSLYLMPPGLCLSRNQTPSPPPAIAHRQQRVEIKGRADNTPIPSPPVIAGFRKSSSFSGCVGAGLFSVPHWRQYREFSDKVAPHCLH